MARSNYADKPIGSGYAPTEYKIFPHDNRKFTPHGGANGEHLQGSLGENSGGDGTWKPQRYAADKGWIWSREMIDATYPDGYVPNVRIAEPAWRTAELEAQMPTFRGVAPSAAELYRGQVFARA